MWVTTAFIVWMLGGITHINCYVSECLNTTRATSWRIYRSPTFLRTTVYYCTVSISWTHFSCLNTTVRPEKNSYYTDDRDNCLRAFLTHSLIDKDKDTWNVQPNRPNILTKNVKRCSNGTVEGKNKVALINMTAFTTTADLATKKIAGKFGTMCDYDKGTCKDKTAHAFWEMYYYEEIPVEVDRVYILKHGAQYLIVKNTTSNLTYPLKLEEKKKFKNLEYWTTNVLGVLAFTRNYKGLKNENATLDVDFVNEDAIDAQFLRFCIDPLRNQESLSLKQEHLKGEWGSLDYAIIFGLVIILFYLLGTLINCFLNCSILGQESHNWKFFFQGYLNKMLYVRMRYIENVKSKCDHDYVYISENLAYKG